LLVNKHKPASGGAVGSDTESKSGDAEEDAYAADGYDEEEDEPEDEPTPKKKKSKSPKYSAADSLISRIANDVGGMSMILSDYGYGMQPVSEGVYKALHVHYWPYADSSFGEKHPSVANAKPLLANTVQAEL